MNETTKLKVAYARLRTLRDTVELLIEGQQALRDREMKGAVLALADCSDRLTDELYRIGKSLQEHKACIPPN